MVIASSNMDRLKDPQEVWQLLLFGGYLTVEEKIAMNEYALKLPNYEVKTFFKDMFVQNLGGFSRFREMIKAFKNFEFDRFEELLNEIFLVSMSYHDKMCIRDSCNENDIKFGSLAGEQQIKRSCFNK